MPGHSLPSASKESGGSSAARRSGERTDRLPAWFRLWQDGAVKDTFAVRRRPFEKAPNTICVSVHKAAVLINLRSAKPGFWREAATSRHRWPAVRVVNASEM